MNNSSSKIYSVLIHAETKEHSALLKKIMEGVFENPRFVVCSDFDKVKSEVYSNNEYDLLVFENEEMWLGERSNIADIKTPIVLLYTDKKCIKYFQSSSHVYLIPKNRLLFQFVEIVKEIFNIKNPVRFKTKVEEKVTKQYFDIPVEIISNLDVAPCDIYVSLGTKKFVKVGNSNESIEKSSIPLYLEKGIKSFYVVNEDYYINEDVFYPQESVDELLRSDKDEAQRAIEIVRDAVSELGFSEVLLDQVDNVINSIYSILDTDEYKGLLSNLDNSKGSYLYNHSYLTSLLSSSYLKTQSWNSMDIQKKVICGSMMHDLGFVNKDNAFYESASKEKIASLPKSVQEDVLNHSKRVVELLKKDRKVPDDVLKIIKSIHLSKDDLESINVTQFNKLCVVVYLSHQVAVRLFKVAFNHKKIPTVLADVYEEFNFGPFNKMIDEYIQNAKATLENAK